MSHERISLGDVARVKKELQPQGAHTWNLILQLLALPLEMRLRQAEASEPIKVSDEPSRGGSTVATGDEADSKSSSTKDAPIFSPGDELSVEPLGRAVSPPDWNEAITRFVDTPDAETPLKAPPLFSSLQERPLITAVAISRSESGELDEERVVDQISRGEPLKQIPRRLRPTSRFGVQVLVDWGERLEPLREDQKAFVSSLAQIVGKHRVQVLRFHEFPDLAGPGTRRTWRPYETPASGTVVLILSDLGLGWLSTPASTPRFSDWAGWARRVTSAGARPIGLVPHGPEHWPAELQHQLPLVHWDRITTVSAIRGMSASWRRKV